MYIIQAYKCNNNYESNNDMTHINPEELNFLKKKCKKEEKKLKWSWEVYTTQRVGPKRRKVPKKLSIGKNNQ